MLVLDMGGLCCENARVPQGFRHFIVLCDMLPPSTDGEFLGREIPEIARQLWELLPSTLRRNDGTVG